MLVRNLNQEWLENNIWNYIEEPKDARQRTLVKSRNGLFLSFSGQGNIDILYGLIQDFIKTGKKIKPYKLGAEVEEYSDDLFGRIPYDVNQILLKPTKSKVKPKWYQLKR